MTLRMSGSHPDVKMALYRRRHVDTEGLVFVENTEEGEREVRDVTVRDCFFDGPLSDDTGHAHLAMCDGALLGSITTKDKRLYSLLSIPDHVAKRSDDVMQVLVTWRQITERDVLSHQGVIAPELQPQELRDQQGLPMSKRAEVAKIEFANYLDKYYIAEAKAKLGRSTNQQLTDLQILKWSSAANILDTNKINYDIKLHFRKIQFMNTHPSWYTTDTTQKIGKRMNLFCAGTKPEKYDQMSISTYKTSDGNVVGLAWIKTLCRPRYRCLASRAVNTNYHTELHEMGHNIALNHDGKMAECDTDPEKKGFMSSNKDWFRSCYKNRINNAIAASAYNCLRTNNLSSGNIGNWLGK